MVVSLREVAKRLSHAGRRRRAHGRIQRTTRRKTVEGKPPDAAQSAPAMVSLPLARDLYDWASKLTSEAGNGLKDYYWTPQMERLVKIPLVLRDP
jgi:hypothetical protein